MFRAKKRKPTSRKVIRNFKDDDDDDRSSDVENKNLGDEKQNQQRQNENDDDVDMSSSSMSISRKIQQKRKQQKQKRGGGVIIRSFNNDDDGDIDDGPSVDNDDDNTKNKKKRRKKKKGLGFGGDVRLLKDPNIMDVEENNIAGTENDSVSYNMKALDQLKAQQKIRPEGLKNASSSVQQEPSSVEAPVQNQQGKEEHEEGDNAGGTTTEHIPSNIPEPLGTTDEALAWEEEIARRAGLQPSTKPNKSRPKPPNLTALRGQMFATLKNLELQQHDLETAYERRRSDLAQAASDMERHKVSLKESGEACTDYQQLRYDLAMWVGAMRDLRRKVVPIWKQITGRMSTKFTSSNDEWSTWQDDVADVLHQRSLLSSVVGRQPQLSQPGEEMPVVDEFGRDMQPLHLRERDKRFRQRQQRISQVAGPTKKIYSQHVVSMLCGDDQDEMQSWRVLQEALTVALEDIEESYKSVSVLTTLFQKWEKNYPDEFSQCYGNLSLGDLASVFATVELCRSDWAKCMLGNAERTEITTIEELFSWTSEMPIDATSRVVEKVHVPFLLSLLADSPSLCFVSSEKSTLLSSFVKETLQYLGQENIQQLDVVLDAIIKAVKKILDEQVAIPLAKVTSKSQNLTESVPPSSPSEEEPIDDATNYALNIQVEWLQQLLLNLLQDWIPLLMSSSVINNKGNDDNKLKQIVLGFIAEKFLLLLSSLPSSTHDDDTSTDAKKIYYFKPLWEILNTKQQHNGDNNNDCWMNSLDFIIQSAPIRAAATAYGLTTTMTW